MKHLNFCAAGLPVEIFSAVGRASILSVFDFRRSARREKKTGWKPVLLVIGYFFLDTSHGL
jgi:hypothetical protein